MIFLAATTDKLSVITSSAATIAVQANYVDAASSTLVASGAGNQNTAISSAATTDFLAAPGASTVRTLKQATWRNKDASLSDDLTVQFNANGTLYEIHKVTLAPGDCLEYIEGVGFFTLTGNAASIIDTAGNTADVTANAADTYLTGSGINVTGLLAAGALFRWRFTMTKTAAGVATPIFNLRYGTAGSTADTSRGTHTLLAQTAATDTGWCDVEAIIRAVGASGQIQSMLSFRHVNTTTGLANAAQEQIKQAISGTFDTTPSGSIIGVSCNPGASGVWTFQSVSVTADGLLKQR